MLNIDVNRVVVDRVFREVNRSVHSNPGWGDSPTTPNVYRSVYWALCVALHGAMKMELSTPLPREQWLKPYLERVAA